MQHLAPLTRSADNGENDDQDLAVARQAFLLDLVLAVLYLARDLKGV